MSIRAHDTRALAAIINPGKLAVPSTITRVTSFPWSVMVVLALVNRL